MPPVIEPQNPVPPPAVTAPTASKTIKAVRIFLLVLIVIGLGLIATEQLWVPKLVKAILTDQGMAPQLPTVSINATSTPAFSQYVNQQLGFTIKIPNISGMPISVFVDSKSSTSSVAYIDYISNNGQTLSNYVQQYINQPTTFNGPQPITIEIDQVKNQQEAVASLQNFYQGCPLSSYQFHMASTSQNGVFYVGLQSSDTVIPQGQVLGENMNDFAGDSDPCAWAPAAEYYPAGEKLAIIQYAVQYCPFPSSTAGADEGGNGPDCYSPQVAHSLQFIQQ